MGKIWRLDLTNVMALSNTSIVHGSHVLEKDLGRSTHYYKYPFGFLQYRIQLTLERTKLMGYNVLAALLFKIPIPSAYGKLLMTGNPFLCHMRVLLRLYPDCRNIFFTGKTGTYWERCWMFSSRIVRLTWHSTCGCTNQLPYAPI